jgi:hypothetical protein
MSDTIHDKVQRLEQRHDRHVERLMALEFRQDEIRALLIKLIERVEALEHLMKLIEAPSA